jgi:hypothetical protein
MASEHFGSIAECGSSPNKVGTITRSLPDRLGSSAKIEADPHILWEAVAQASALVTQIKSGVQT